MTSPFIAALVAERLADAAHARLVNEALRANRRTRVPIRHCGTGPTHPAGSPQEAA